MDPTKFQTSPWKFITTSLKPPARWGTVPALSMIPSTFSEDTQVPFSVSRFNLYERLLALLPHLKTMALSDHLWGCASLPL